MSHELCTPLNGIIGLSDALLSDPSLGLPATLVKTMTVIKISGKRLLQLIYEILDIAKMQEEGGISIKAEVVDMKALVADVVELAGTLVHKGVHLRSDIQHMPKVIGDTGRVLQVRSSSSFIRNVSVISPYLTLIDFHCLKISFLDQSIQKRFYVILKKYALQVSSE